MDREVEVMANHRPLFGTGLHHHPHHCGLHESGLVVAAAGSGSDWGSWRWDGFALPAAETAKVSDDSSPTESWSPGYGGTDQKRKQILAPAGTSTGEDGDGGRGLVLSLGANVYEEGGDKKSKRCRSYSPGATSYPKCQVDDCGADLTRAKDYHRRHKVCEAHSKATQAVVHQILQRFCQQCSRFHSLVLFDEGKRSCRRRLAGHNRRRRKGQPDTAPKVASLAPKSDAGSQQFLNMVTLLSQIQSASFLEGGSQVLRNQEVLLNIIKKAGVSVANDTNNRAQVSDRTPTSPAQEEEEEGEERLCLPSSSSPLSSIKGQEEDIHHPVPNPVLNPIRSPIPIPSELNPNGLHRFVNAFEPSSPLNIEKCNGSEIEVLNLIDRVGSSAVDTSLPTTTATTTLCGESSPWNHQVARPDIETRGDSLIELQGFNRSPGSYCQARIALKLMDVDPSTLPENAQLQFLKWIAAFPSVVETYIRPGCVILTAFLSMPAQSCQELSANLQEHLDRFLKSSSGSFWNKGKIIAQMGVRQFLVMDGHITLASQMESKACPRLKSVRPLAAVAGEETVLIVEGQNLAKGTKIICSYLGKYKVHEVDTAVDEEQKTSQDLQVQKFQFDGGPRGAVGRCFVEVLDELAGDFLPVIVADAVICEELQMLEKELDSYALEKRVESSANLTTTSGCYRREMGKEAIYGFLHELGWVFQKSSAVSGRMDSGWALPLPCFAHLLSFAVLRDWCGVTKKLLDILFTYYYHISSSSSTSLKEVEEMLRDSNLVHQAVKQKHWRMVEFLLSYIPPCRISEVPYLFNPLAVSAGNLTPLHIAASMPDSLGTIDALTNDPCKLGLQAWKNARDTLGQTPQAYAIERSYYSYLNLVDKKVDKSRPESFAIRIGDCKSCCRQAALVAQGNINISGIKGTMYRPLILSMVAIATLCVCVALFLKSPPRVGGLLHPLRWEDIDFGAQ